MIISRTPFRISFCGGGSDLPAFYEKHGGCVVSTGIDKYMYISVHPSFYPEKTVLKYSKTEIVEDLNEIQHPYYKVLLKRFNANGLEITSTADIPAGTGLGSSSSFTVGVLNALYAYQGMCVPKEQLASEACRIEIIDVGEPIGKQDQYAAAFGGLNYYKFCKDGSVYVEPVIMAYEKCEQLQRNLLMVYVGGMHSASEILKEQGENVKNGERENSQMKICSLAEDLRDELTKGNIDSMGEILDESWKLKRLLSTGITNQYIDECYEKGIRNGALGGKLLGAGGCGFLLFYVMERDRDRLKKSLGLPVLPIRFDGQGTTVIYFDNRPKHMM